MKYQYVKKKPKTKYLYLLYRIPTQSSRTLTVIPDIIPTIQIDSSSQVLLKPTKPKTVRPISGWVVKVKLFQRKFFCKTVWVSNPGADNIVAMCIDRLWERV